MKDSIILFLFLIPTFLFAQYPTGSNKSRLGWQTTGDGLIWRGVAADTVNKPNNRNYPYFQLDTVNAVLYRYIQTRGKWQPVSESVNIDSLIYATRYWVNSNFFPLQGGLLTGTGGNGFVGFPLQSSPPATPATGFSLFAGSTGNNISWMQPDGFFRRLVSPATGTPRQYQFMARSYTLADSADVANNVTSIAANYLATSNGTNLVARNLFDNNTYVGILNSKPFLLGQWTTAGRPGSVNGYMGYNTTLTGIDWYNGTRWATALESTFARGTATRIPFFDANGQVTDDDGISWSSSLNNLTINGTGSNGLITLNPITAADGSMFVTSHAAWVSRRNTSEADYSSFAVGAPSGDFSARLSVGLYTGAPYIGFGSGAANRDVFIQRPVSTQALTFNFTTSNTECFRFTNTASGFFTSSPTQELDVNGDAYIRDSLRLTSTPAHTSITGLLTRDANGWVGATTLAGLTYDNGALAARRDTAIYVTDADYNFSAAVTSANILKRYGRIIIYSKLSSGASSDNQIILHSASSDFLQCEIIIYSNDASADADATSIDFTTNGAVDGSGGTVSSYGMSAGQRVNIRAVNDGGYKWFFN